MQNEHTQRVALQESIEAILAKTSGEGWSARRLAEKIGISARTWSRILIGQADLKVWLPKLRDAANRLQEQP